MFGFPPGLSRSGSSRSYRPVSPLGASRYERPMEERSERLVRRDREERRPGYGEPDLTRVESRDYRDYSRRPSPPRRRGSDYAGVDISALSGGFDPSRRRRSPSASRYADFDRLYDSAGSSSRRFRGGGDYLDTLGSGYERSSRREEYYQPMGEYYPSSRPGEFYPSSSRREPTGEYYPPLSRSSRREPGYYPSSQSRSSRRSTAADALGQPFGGGYTMPSDDNRYVYPSRSSRERRSRRDYYC